MQTVFVAGSISITHLHEKVKRRIENVIHSGMGVVVGDANGADSSIQKFLFENGAKLVTVYCSGDEPRNNIADWPVKNIYSGTSGGRRAYFTAKDIEMARDSDFGLMVWDCKSTGTLSNVIELLREKKKSVVFVNKHKDFINVSDTISLEGLVGLMSDRARERAEEKIGLSKRIAGISRKQFSLAI